jgi:hypothetical protein
MVIAFSSLPPLFLNALGAVRDYGMIGEVAAGRLLFSIPYDLSPEDKARKILVLFCQIPEK